jgi:hypothetical protein
MVMETVVGGVLRPRTGAIILAAPIGDDQTMSTWPLSHSEQSRSAWCENLRMRPPAA